MLNTVFAGKLDDQVAIAAVGIGNATNSMFLFSVTIGVNLALDTLNSEAYGNNNLQLCGTYLNRGRFIQLSFSVPLAIMVYFLAEDLLTLLG